ncbi:DNA maturase B [Pseudomonas sp. HMWF032]|uniref:phage terminase large subunit n=1 Tax=Pseudomonas sp. HMWF032 TaxID=2056866 RepID=UPI000D3491A5|nr:phage terminase large subunit [Pseudomonas sp. HMWF032]PTS86428.1 DNA maturase B [Pseudomonas sp. HMWF032]PTT81383.1 DNA maturase B [Pseudomonas sp. HMWF010]
MTQEEQKKLITNFALFVWVVWKSIGLPPPTPIQTDMANTLQTPPSRRFIIQGFRGVAKSFITCAYVVWMLWRNPNLKIMIVSASKERADANAQFIKKIIAELPFLTHLKAGRDQRDTQNIFDVGPAKPDHSPSVKSVGITGQLTGSRADIIIADDVEVPGNSFTQAMRDKLFELVKEFDAILKPQGSVIYLGTPQNEMSLYNELQERGYTTYIWPARFPYDEKHRASYGSRLAPYIARLFDANPKIAGSPTDPKRFDDDDLRERELSYRRAGFMLQFMLDTSLSDADKYPLKLRDLIVTHLGKEEAPLKFTWMPSPQGLLPNLPLVGLKGDRYYGPHSMTQDVGRYTYKILVVDPSGRGKDETGYAVLFFLNGFIFLMEVGGLLGGYSDETLEALAKIAKKWQVNEAVIEGNFGDGMYTKLFTPVLAGIHKCAITEVKSKGQKEVRIIDTLEPLVTNHRFVVNLDAVQQDYDSAASTEPFYSFFYQYTRLTADRGSLKSDDRLDAVAIGVAHLCDVMDVSPDEGVKTAREDFFEDALEGLMNITSSVLHVCGLTVQMNTNEGVEGSLEGLNWMDN